MTRQLICISCPMGCPMTVTLEDGQVRKVEGNACKRGEIYAGKECVHPTRTVTSTVRIHGGVAEMLPVKTRSDIPKERIFACMEALKSVEVAAPVSMGDVILSDVAGTGVDIVATRSVPQK